MCWGGDYCDYISDDLDLNIEGAIVSFDGAIYVALEDEVSLGNAEDGYYHLFLPEKGTYFRYFNDEEVIAFVEKFTINGYTGFPKEQVKEEYLPSVPYVIEYDVANHEISYSDEIFNLLPHELLTKVIFFVKNQTNGDGDFYHPSQSVYLDDGNYNIQGVEAGVIVDPISKTIELD